MVIGAIVRVSYGIALRVPVSSGMGVSLRSELKLPDVCSEEPMPMGNSASLVNGYQ